MKIKVEYKATSKLIPYENNTRTHSTEQIQQIADSIIEFGFTNPILIDSSYGIVAGHGRYMAAQQLELTEVPTIMLSGLTEAQRRAYVIADNKLSLNSGWNTEMLKQELLELKELDFDISLTAFSDPELLNIMLDVEEGVTDPYAEWEGMPEYVQPNKQSYRHVVVHFNNEQDAGTFFNLIGQEDKGKTKSIWHPQQEFMDTESKRYN
jgi:hypothetical protein